MTGDDGQGPRAAAGNGSPVITTFTREELDAAEPERRRSPATRVVIGLGIGFLAWSLGLALGGPILLVSVVAIPLAWTWTGAGVLIGFGAPATIAAAVAWLAPGPDWDAGSFIVLVPATGYVVGCLVVGTTAVTVRLALERRGHVIDEAAIFRRHGPRDRAR